MAESFDLIRLLTLSRLGKVLLDDKTIEACEIREKDFLVLMVSKVIQFTPFGVRKFIGINSTAKNHTSCFHQRGHACATAATGTTDSACSTRHH